MVTLEALFLSRTTPVFPSWPTTPTEPTEPTAALHHRVNIYGNLYSKSAGTGQVEAVGVG